MMYREALLSSALARSRNECRAAPAVADGACGHRAGASGVAVAAAASRERAR